MNGSFLVVLVVVLAFLAAAFAVTRFFSTSTAGRNAASAMLGTSRGTMSVDRPFRFVKDEER